jgi:TonB family protein
MQTLPVTSTDSRALSSDLVKLCLPSAQRDSHRALAYVNSICLLFLVAGLIGLRAPLPSASLATERVEIVPVVFVPPEPPPAPSSELVEQHVEGSATVILETPVVATVTPAATVGAARLAVPVANAAFPVPVHPVAAPSSQVQTSPSPPASAASAGLETGSFPWPREYPRQAQQQRHEGTVLLAVRVNPDGQPVSVTVKDSSGHVVLDQFALRWVKANWRWPAGGERSYLVPFKFRLRQS